MRLLEIEVPPAQLPPRFRLLTAGARVELVSEALLVVENGAAVEGTSRGRAEACSCTREEDPNSAGVEPVSQFGALGPAGAGLEGIASRDMASAWCRRGRNLRSHKLEGRT